MRLTRYFIALRPDIAAWMAPQWIIVGKRTYGVPHDH